MKTTRWAILGTGKIARKFAAQLPESDTGELVAVASRDVQRAADFAHEFQAARYGTYESITATDNIDAVYISLPNTLHHPWTIKCLTAGKHVLCEKPLATRSEDAEEMFDVAAAQERVLVEAFMYRTHPAIQHLLAQLHGESPIGDVKLIRTHFTFQREPDPSDIRYQVALGGGALMDVGCYCLNLARAVVGREPTRAVAYGHTFRGGVDEYSAGILDFGGDVFCTFDCGMTVFSDLTTHIIGHDGYIEIDTPWFTEGCYDIVRGKHRETVTRGADKRLYALEADAFAAAIAGRQPPVISRDDSIGNTRLLEQLVPHVQ